MVSGWRIGWLKEEQRAIERERKKVPAEELPKLPTPDRKGDDAPIESPTEAWWDE